MLSQKGPKGRTSMQGYNFEFTFFPLLSFHFPRVFSLVQSMNFSLSVVHFVFSIKYSIFVVFVVLDNKYSKFVIL